MSAIESEVIEMNNLQKLIIDLGIGPNIALAVLVLFAVLLIIITILYLCVPFFLLRIRKEIIELNRNLRSLYLIQRLTEIDENTEVVSDENTEVVSDEDKEIYDEKSSKNIKKLQLDDEDIKKLKALGFGMSDKDKA
jgi:hypothetical protein